VQEEDKLSILKQLRDRIPEIKCIPGCTQCCGHTAWSEFEWYLIPEEKRKEFDFFSLKCSFCKDGGCSIHEHRPIICRMFGVCEGMTCPMGVPVETMLTEETARAITREYVKHFFKGDVQ
jgi:Fe-S-cluster containining protein